MDEVKVREALDVLIAYVDEEIARICCSYRLFNDDDVKFLKEMKIYVPD